MPSVNTRHAGDASVAYEAIMDAIVTQRLAPSQKVSENILTDMFDISRTMARNLMEQLAAQQFLQSVSPRITRIAPLTLLDVKQNFAIRKMLQPRIFVMAAPHIDYAKLDALSEAMMSAAAEAMRDDESALQLLKLNKAFNLLICESVKYPLLMNWVQQLEYTSMRIYWLYVKLNNALPFSLEKQGEVVDHMKGNREDEIYKFADLILSTGEERVVNAIFSHEKVYTQDLKV